MTRGRLLLAARIAVSLALLWLLFWRLPEVDLDDLVPDWSTATGAWLLAATTALVAAYALQVLRWQSVLVALGTHVRYRSLVSPFAAGQFVSNALPTTFGGDYVRVARLGGAIDDTPAAFASVVLERLVGWMVLPLIATVSLVAQPDLLGQRGEAGTALVIAAITLATLLAVLAVAGSDRMGSRVTAHNDGWRAFIGAVHVGVVRLRGSERRLAAMLGVGAAFQVVQCVSVWMLARALDVPNVTFGVVLAFFPAIAIAQNLPLGFGGLGVREGAFVLFLNAVGVPDAKAIALGLAVYLLTVAVSLAGAPAFIWGNRRERDADLAVEAADLATELERRATLDPPTPAAG